MPFSSSLFFALFAATDANSADLGPAVNPPSSQWQFSFTPYGWMTNVNGNATARGHTVDINDSFFEIVEKSDSLMALMGYFEARKGGFSLFTDVVWEDLGFPGHAKDDFNRQASGRPFDRFPGVDVSVDANLHIKANAQLDYQSTIIQSGVGFEVANWSGPSSRTCIGPFGWRSLLESKRRHFDQPEGQLDRRG